MYHGLMLDLILTTVHLCCSFINYDLQRQDPIVFDYKTNHVWWLLAELYRRRFQHSCQHVD